MLVGGDKFVRGEAIKLDSIVMTTITTTTINLSIELGERAAIRNVVKAEVVGQ
jgi:hypothetical protein